MDMSDPYEGWAGAGGRFQLAVRGFSCIEVILMTQLGTLGQDIRRGVSGSRFECIMLAEG
jgi:hypothetical protein